MSKITRRTFVLGGATAPFVMRSSASFAQSAASNVIKIVVPFPPGGTVDPIARMVQPGLQQKLNATVIIENKPGASGSLGTAQVAKSPADGTNFVFVFDTHAVNPFLQTLPFDTVKDLDPVMLIGTAPNIISTHPSRPFKSFADVIAAAKAKPDTITYASIGNGSLGHLTGVLLSQRAGVRMVHVPYRGGGPAMNDALAGHVDLLIGSAALVTPQVKGGRLIALGQTGKTRISALPDIPTAIESGFAGFESYAWWGVFTTAGSPKPAIERFTAALGEALRDPAITKNISENLQITMRMDGPDGLGKFLAEQMKLWGPVVREHNIKGDA